MASGYPQEKYPRFPNDEQLLWHMNSHVKSESLLESEEITLNLDPEHDMWQDYSEVDATLLDARGAVSKSDNRPHECHICHKRFKRKQHLKVHSNVHNKLDLAAYSSNVQLCDLTIWCSLCNSGFRRNEEFEAHDCMMLDGNSENINGDQVQSDEQYLVKDETNTTEYNQPIVQIPEDVTRPVPVPQRVFVCKYCGKPFRRRDHYKIHLNIHTGNKSFFCPECGKGFYRKDHLQKHTTVHRKKPVVTRGPPDLLPLNMMHRKTTVQPEITIHAPSNSRLRVPLQIKVPYEVVMSTKTGEHRTLVNPSENEYDTN